VNSLSKELLRTYAPPRRAFTPTPRRYRYGIIAAYSFSNWGDLPIGVISSIMTSAPFNPGTDEALGIAYVAIFILINYISRASPTSPIARSRSKLTLWRSFQNSHCKVCDSFRSTIREPSQLATNDARRMENSARSGSTSTDS